MADIINEKSYFATVIKNMDSKDFEANDKFFEVFSSVGDEVDLQRIESNNNNEPYSVEMELCECNLESWLLFMENERLHKALSHLTCDQLEFIFELVRFDFNQRDYADNKGVSKQAVSKRFRKICKEIKKYF